MVPSENQKKQYPETLSTKLVEGRKPNHGIQEAKDEDMAHVMDFMAHFSPLVHVGFLQFIRDALLANRLKAENFLLAHAGEDITGLLIWFATEKGAGEIWPPWVTSEFRRRDIEGALLEQAVTRLENRRVDWMQILLEEGERNYARLIQPLGFDEVTHLQVLFHALKPTQQKVPAISEINRLSFVRYSETPTNLFLKTWQKTFEASLDFPELNKIQAGKEKVVSNEGFAIHGGAYSYLAVLKEDPVGVIVLKPGNQPFHWDLDYLGLVPNARGFGLGKELLRKSIQIARENGGQNLTVAADERNGPALALYQSQGFFLERDLSVFMKFC